MSKVAVKVENLGKKYIIKHEKTESHKTFQDVLINSGKKIITSLNPFNKQSFTKDTTTEEFWALNDVNFEINQGDRVGIIGRNGAGKSTLLKVLSRITEPTSGKIHINGRIASLLEVGTGFHPELTGRENIYLNGAILGMSRKEIRAKFDEIVAFAEVDKFLDTPVKRYSSGMYVRLAFSVAAHLEPEILVVDEVLAVGDVEFQKRCLGKMQDVSKGGRTILFVSHNMGSIAKLCNKGIYFEDGKAKYIGNIEKCILKYQENTSATHRDVQKQIRNIPNNKHMKFDEIRVLQKDIATVYLENGASVAISIKYTLKQDLKNFHIYFRVLTPNGDIIFETLHEGKENNDYIQSEGLYESIAELPSNFFNEGHYYIEVYSAIHQLNVLSPEPILIPIQFYRTGIVNKKYMEYKSPGIILPDISWTTHLINSSCKSKGKP
jgi:lipopolysaccharide transport system ATP-binding protein